MLDMDDAVQTNTIKDIALKPRDNKKIAAIDPNLPPEVQQNMFKINADIKVQLASERTRQYALIGLAIVAIMIAGGSIYLATLSLTTPDFLGVVFGGLIGFIAGGMASTAYHAGAAKSEVAVSSSKDTSSASVK